MKKRAKKSIKIKREGGWALVGLVVLFILLVLFVQTAEKKDSAVENFLNGSRPENVIISNLSDTAFTVSFITGKKASGVVLYGEKEADRQTVDDRVKINGQNKGFYTHHVTISDLTLNTKYVFKIESGGRVFSNKGKLFNVTTLSEVQSADCEEAIWGNVVSDSPTDLIVYAKSSENIVSTITDDKGFFRIDFGDKGFCPTVEDVLEVVFEGGGEGSYKKELVVGGGEGLENIILEKVKGVGL